jgi:anti-anti-sigma factor
MQCEHKLEERGSVIHLCPRFVFESHKSFRLAVDTAMEANTGRDIHVDMNQVEYLDSSALGMILLLREKAEARGYNVVLRGAKGIALQVLQTARFDQLFKLI